MNIARFLHARTCSSYDHRGIMDLPPCVFDVFVAPNLGAKSITRFALVCYYANACVHGCDNYEANCVFNAYRAYHHHPVNVLVRTDQACGIRSGLGVRWRETLDANVLATRLVQVQAVRVLSLACTNVIDISALAICVNLTNLSLAHTRVANISPLATCVNLTVLVLYYTRVTIISPLATCVRMTHLYISNTNITDTSALSHLVARGLQIYGP